MDNKTLKKSGVNHVPTANTSGVIVKFKAAYIETQQIPYNERIEQDPEQYLGQDWTDLVRKFPGLGIQRIVTSLNAQQLIDIVKDAKLQSERDHRTYPYPDNHFLTYFVVRHPPGTDAAAVTAVLRSWKTIELAYIEGKVTPPAGAKPGTTDENILGLQPYLGPPPVGINATTAWEFSGGDGGDDVGLGLQFADLEQGWYLTHPDLPSGIQFIGATTGANYVDHGTLVLGIVLAVPNDIECVGIAPNVTTTMVTSCWPGRMSDVCNAIAAVIPPAPDDSKLRPGDVLLLEAQTLLNEPVEVDSVVYQFIQNATSRNITVVEAAGNGKIDLDDYLCQGLSLLNRSSSQFLESGAIMVAAATLSDPHYQKPASNFGSRIDCYAGGDSIYSTSSTGGYNTLSDTSAAAAIIAGAALSIQGIAQQFSKGSLPNHRLSAVKLRQYLRNPATGTLSAQSNWDPIYDSTWDDPAHNPDFLKWNHDRIGVMPNLGAIIDQTLELHHIGHRHDGAEIPPHELAAEFPKDPRRGPGPRHDQ
jgi:serine protease